MNNQIIREFKNPGSQFRGAPFWAWNGKLDPDELRQQIRLMHEMGLGGFFMHSRVGLNTAYLSKEWFDCVKACIDEARKRGMYAWLYDEDRWPSGAAGGLVTKNPRFRMRQLVMDILDNPKTIKWNKDVLAVFTAKVDGSHTSNLQQIAQNKRPAKLETGEQILLFRVCIHNCSSWYNGYTYLDTLSHAAVRQFIKVTHQAYQKQIGKYFGGVVPGIFTDEPNYGYTHENPYRIPWTPLLPRVFKKRYGYDLIPHLPKLFLDTDDPAAPACYHFHDCITHLFVDAFSRQIGEWCAKNKILFTGHVLGEEGMRSQTNVVGNTMRFYEHMQAPGMDLLTERWRIFNTAKQVSSVARQFGRKWRLTETYGCTGWDFPFLGHKALGDWQIAMGINLLCQHLSWYTMQAEAKRDYPAGVFYQSTWWNLFPKVQDYFGRILSVMTHGNEVRDLLVIFPIESMWLMFKPSWRKNEEASKFDLAFVHLTYSLYAGNIDFDFGDEELMSRHGRIRKKFDKVVLAVNKAEYKCVLVPALKTIRSSTLNLLKKFQEAGGKVVFSGPAPSLVNALPSEQAIEFAKNCALAPDQGKGFVDAVSPLCRRISITDPKGNEIESTLHLLREDKDAFYLFVCNTSEDFNPNGRDILFEPMARDRKLSFPEVVIRGFENCQGTPLEFDPDTGEFFTADTKQNNSQWEIYTSFPALRSRLFIIPKKDNKKEKPAQRLKLSLVKEEIFENKEYAISLSEDSCLVLDRPKYKLGNGEWQAQEEILRIDQKVHDALGIQHRGGSMVQPWAREKPKKEKSIPVELLYSFEVKAIPSGSVFLAIEMSKTFQIAVNGTALNMEAECGWWCDHSLRKVPLDPALLRLGKNEITLKCNYKETHPGLEIIYLLGHFGTAVNGTEVLIVGLPQKLKIGDWVEQGLSFYSGSVAYHTTIRPKLEHYQRLFMSVPEYCGTAVRIIVNGTPAGVIAWEPNELDITDLIAGQDSVDLAIEVIGHRRNSHGPFHLNEKWPHWTGPGEFVASKEKWFDGYQLVPCGLMQPPKLVIRSF